MKNTPAAAPRKQKQPSRQTDAQTNIHVENMDEKRAGLHPTAHRNTTQIHDNINEPHISEYPPENKSTHTQTHVAKGETLTNVCL